MEEPTNRLKQATEYVNSKDVHRALPILLRLIQAESPVRGANLLFAKLSGEYSFTYLGLEAARREHALFGCSEASALASAIEHALRSAQRFVPQLPLISFIAVARTGEEADWTRCIESLSLQMNLNIDLCLITESPVSTWGILPSFVSVYPSVARPINKKAEISRALHLVKGSVISVIERPRTVFCSTGNTFAAVALHSNPSIELLQSETVYPGAGRLVESCRPGPVQWSQALLIDPISLELPAMMFSWRGVFFSRERLLELLPFDDEIEYALAMDLAAKFLRSGAAHTINTPVLVDDGPIMARGFQPSLHEIADARLIIRRESSLLRQAPSATHAGVIDPLPQATLSHDLPKIFPTVLQSGRIAAPPISLVTPVLNGREYLAQCFDSILSQNYPNLEYIVLDGGSTDGTVELIKKYERYISFWRSAPDGGQYASINNGLARTTGTIMSWLNADDYLAPYTLELVASLFTSHSDMEWLTGSYCFLGPGTSLTLTGTPVLSGEVYFDDGFDRPFVQQEGTFWRRSLWERAGGALDVRLELAADMELWTRFFQYAHPYITSVPLAVFRRHSGQRSQILLNRYMNEAYRVIGRLKSCGAKPFVHPNPDETRLVIPLVDERKNDSRAAWTEGNSNP